MQFFIRRTLQLCTGGERGRRCCLFLGVGPPGSHPSPSLSFIFSLLLFLLPFPPTPRMSPTMASPVSTVSDHPRTLSSQLRCRCWAERLGRDHLGGMNRLRRAPLSRISGRTLHRRCASTGDTSARTLPHAPMGARRSRVRALVCAPSPRLCARALAVPTSARPRAHIRALAAVHRSGPSRTSPPRLRARPPPQPSRAPPPLTIELAQRVFVDMLLLGWGCGWKSSAPPLPPPPHTKISAGAPSPPYG
jgi:hypothetical protein